MPRFAANLSMMFTEHAFLDRFQAAADAGFEAVEYLFPYAFPAETVAARLSQAGLKQALFNMPPGDWDAGERGLAALPKREDDFRDALSKAIDYAGIIGTPLLHMMAGLADSSNTQAHAAYLRHLEQAAEATANAGLGLVIEPINRRDMPGYFLNDFNQAVDILSTVDKPHVKLQFDIYHRQILHGDVMMALRDMMPVIGHIQIASVPDRHEPMSGELNDARIFAEIDRLGYHGYVGCEYRPAGKTVDGLNWMQNL